ncbi:MAG: hypothetical protein R3346_04505 [Candidatus Spechtbacterales bacterium]|nr:hypothetical protein [Candidatus Spechtbacterales bacterium]
MGKRKSFKTSQDRLEDYIKDPENEQKLNDLFQGIEKHIYDVIETFNNYRKGMIPYQINFWEITPLVLHDVVVGLKITVLGMNDRVTKEQIPKHSFTERPKFLARIEQHIVKKLQLKSRHKVVVVLDSEFYK